MADTAQNLYQANLDALTDAIWHQNWEVVPDLIGLPELVRTADAEHVFTCHDELRESLIEQRRSLRRLGVSDYHRICFEAAFAGKTVIEGRHHTYIMRGGHYVLPPIRNRMRLELDGGLWRATSILTDLRNRDYTIISPKALSARAPVLDTGEAI